MSHFNFDSTGWLTTPLIAPNTTTDPYQNFYLQPRYRPADSKLIREADQATLEWEIPGVEKEDVIVSIEVDSIRVKAKNKTKIFENLSAYDLEKSEASLNLGVLKIVIPAKAKKTIEVK